MKTTIFVVTVVVGALFRAHGIFLVIFGAHFVERLDFLGSVDAGSIDFFCDLDNEVAHFIAPVNGATLLEPGLRVFTGYNRRFLIINFSLIAPTFLFSLFKVLLY